MTYKSRKDIPEKYKWNIEAMYKDSAACEKDIKKCLELADKFTKYQGHLKDSAIVLAAALKDRDTLYKKYEDICIYAQQKTDEDRRVSSALELLGKTSSMAAQIGQKMAFFSPELAAIPEKTLRKFIKENKDLKVYEHHLDEVIREKAHVLKKSDEELLAKLSELTGCPEDVYRMLSDAEFDFGQVHNEKGKLVKLTHGSYMDLVRSKDRSVRKEAYEKLYNVYKGYRNTLATTYNYNVKQDVIYSKIRKYESSRAAALSRANIPEEVYNNLVKVVNEHLPALHRYMKLRKKVLGLKDMAMYDVYTPILPKADKKYSYEEGQKLALTALNVMGKEYVSDLKKGYDSRWADVYETEGKRSGAYSFGSYNSMPYMLLNYHDKLDDVFTLIHESGHSMHSYYTRKNQPYVYGDYSIFAAEVASTVNESILMNYLINNAKSKKEKAELLNMWLDEFRTTLFRQTQFAEFELEAHRMVERGEVLTADNLEKLYGDINKKYYGPAIKYDKLIQLEWSRIPHFYSAYYVYQYATGYSAATAIATKITNEGETAAKEYLKFLKAGSSNYPIEVLKYGGVDMASTEPIEAAMNKFEELLDELEAII